MSRRRKHRQEHVNHERWLVSYADFVTLLFAFFVVLYASSQVDKRKVSNLSLAIHAAFQQLGVFDTSNTKLPLSDSAAVRFTQARVLENVQRSGDLGQFVEPMKGIVSPSAGLPLQDVADDLRKALAPEIKKNVASVKAVPEGIVVSLQEVGFYESGASNIRASSQGAIDRLAAVLESRGESLRIEGHTDNIPIHNQRFDSNWELSTARASDFIRLFILQYHFDASRLSAAGFAEYHPIALNDTPENRARNRRVDIVVLNSIPH